MAKTLVDIPEAKLAAAQVALGAASKRETIERALDLVNRQAAQLALIDAVAAGELAADFTPGFITETL